MRLSEVGKQAVATIGAEESLESAAKLMRDLHVGDLIVVEFKDGRKTPVGILTDRDIVMATVALGAHPEVLNVGEIMTRKLVIAREVDSLARVIELMYAAGWVLENEKPQQLVVFENQNQPITVVVMLDTSGSMTGSIKLLKEAAEQ